MRNLSSIKKACIRVLKSKTVSTFGVMTGAGMVSSVILGLSGLLMARWIDPGTMGLFRKFAIPAGYGAILLIFVSDGLRREYPYLIGKGNKAEAIALAGVARSWYLICTLVMCLVFVCLMIWNICVRDWVSVAGWGTQIAFVLMTYYGSFLATIYRRSLEFKQLSYNGLASTFSAVLCLPFVKFFGYYGMAFRQVVVNLVGLAMNIRYLPEKIPFRVDCKRFGHLAKISVPLTLVGYLRTSFLDSSFNYIVLSKFGQASLGLYGVAMSFQGFAMQFVTAIQQIFNVKIANKFGETESIEKSFRYLILPTILGVGVSVFVSVCLCVVVGPFINYVLPKYKMAVPVIWVLSLHLPITAASMPTEILKVALNYRAISTGAILRVVSIILALLLLPKTIVWCAVATLIGGCVEMLNGYIFLWLCSRERHV